MGWKTPCAFLNGNVASLTGTKYWKIMFFCIACMAFSSKATCGIWTKYKPALAVLQEAVICPENLERLVPRLLWMVISFVVLHSFLWKRRIGAAARCCEKENFPYSTHSGKFSVPQCWQIKQSSVQQNLKRSELFQNKFKSLRKPSKDFASLGFPSPSLLLPKEDMVSSSSFFPWSLQALTMSGFGWQKDPQTAWDVGLLWPHISGVQSSVGHNTFSRRWGITGWVLLFERHLPHVGLWFSI